MNKSAKKSIEKTKKSIKKAVKEIKSVEKKVKSLKTINNVSKDIETTVVIKSEKFNRWVKTLGVIPRKIMYVLPLVLFRVCSLLVINKTLYTNIIKKYDTAKTVTKDFSSLTFIEKVYDVLYKFFNELAEKPVTFLAEIVLLTSIFLDDIPSIFNSENYKLKDLEKIRKIDIASNVAKKYLEAADVCTGHVKQKENKEIQEKFDVEMDKLNNNLGKLKDELETHKVALDALTTIKNPISPPDFIVLLNPTATKKTFSYSHSVDTLNPAKQSKLNSNAEYGKQGIGYTKSIETPHQTFIREQKIKNEIEGMGYHADNKAKNLSNSWKFGTPIPPKKKSSKSTSSGSKSTGSSKSTGISKSTGTGTGISKSTSSGSKSTGTGISKSTGTGTGSSKSTGTGISKSTGTGISKRNDDWNEHNDDDNIGDWVKPNSTGW